MSNSVLSMRTKRVVLVGAALTTAAAMLTACSSDDSDTTAPSATISSAAHSAGGSAHAGAHNEADVEFNTMMIPHHQQAVEMADLVGERTTNPQVRALADRIRGAQQPEIDEMTGRLKSWGLGTPDHDMSGHGAQGHGGMAGMMTDEEMTAMSDARGAEFDRLWLEGMIRHHEGAVAMSDAELADGQDAASKALATRIRDAQKAEIAEMKGLLGQ